MFLDIFETFFFVSLGISFLLILSVVFHFKTRIQQLEEKCEDLSENNNKLIVQLLEMKTIQREMYENSTQTIPFMYPFQPSLEESRFPTIHILEEIMEPSCSVEELEDEEINEESDEEEQPDEEPLKEQSQEQPKEQSQEQPKKTFSQLEKDVKIETKPNKYSEMNVTTLREIALSKGKCNVESKLKKKDLIKLLEES